MYIHFHGANVFGTVAKEQGTEYIRNNINYPPINIVPMFLTHNDVYLDYFKCKQKEIEKLSGNENLKINDLFKFSKDFRRKIEALKNKDYHINEIKVNFIVYWKGKDMKNEIKIILPKITLLYKPR